MGSATLPLRILRSRRVSILFWLMLVSKIGCAPPLPCDPL